MAKKVEIKKTVFDRQSYRGVIDSKFKFFKELEPVVDPDTVEELFRLYDQLYAVIPIEGEDNSHQYLVERSSELYKIDTQLDSIQPLLDEVASLREQLLENNRRILELETQLAGGGELDFGSAEQMELLKSQLETANSTIATLEQANTLANKATEAATEAAQKAAAEAKKSAEQQAAQASTTSAATTQASKDVAEIIGIFKKNRSQLWYAKRVIEKRLFITFRGYRNRNYNYRQWGQKYFWLFASGKVEANTSWNRRRNSVQTYTYFIPQSEQQAADLSLDFIIAELNQAGYKAADIVAAIQQNGNFKGRVSVRVITYKDKDREDKVGYRLVK
jgi:chemotaxis protein histidine kinase CheA